MRIVGYVHRADTYCPSCLVSQFWREYAGLYPESIEEIEDYLNARAESMGVDREDETSFDSGDFPKAIFSTDETSPCGVCGEEIA